MVAAPTVLVHLCSETDWARAQFDGELRPPSLDDVGFVHLSAPEQVHLPANRLYRGQSDLLLLVCDPERLGSPVRWEPGVPTDPASMLFPHLYGALPVAAVARTVPYRPDVEGVFAVLPANFGADAVG
ncbi:DUF952 domain-containing protein [Mycolicibacterium mucogenicum]|uniref:DUF952 domain-containing protein n=1 Tax=Mycolicibacterium mucogenicum TaxID=56689 RepID=UPI00226A38A4|nr:DUF952 domain-containing protein [Mycolicibacterium mucogenicum]MCX8557933.1 DUF952 domain-containing protein [Mycolicibacterium mucogenicum]